MEWSVEPVELGSVRGDNVGASCQKVITDTRDVAKVLDIVSVLPQDRVCLRWVERKVINPVPQNSSHSIDCNICIWDGCLLVDGLCLQLGSHEEEDDTAETESENDGGQLVSRLVSLKVLT